MLVRKTEEKDISEILKIYDSARDFMRDNGNHVQWPEEYPSEETIREDMEKDCSYVVEEDGEMIGTFALIFGEDPTYQVIENGEWRRDKEYGTIHRIASNGKGSGMSDFVFDFCKKKADYLRVDTHKVNDAMRDTIMRNGFKETGKIYFEDGTPRIAYDWIKGEDE